MTHFASMKASHRVAQVHVIFTLSPSSISQILHSSGLLCFRMSTEAAPQQLAYVEWFSIPDSRSKHTPSGMYQITQSLELDGQQETAIVPIDALCRGCHLYPKFGDGHCTNAWTAVDVLDKYQEFFIDPYVDSYSFQIVW